MLASCKEFDSSSIPMIRKVKSLDFGLLRPSIQSVARADLLCMASNYSKAAHDGRYTVRRVTIVEDSGPSLLNNSLSYTNFGECDTITTPVQGENDDETFIAKLRRPATLGYVSVLMLLFVSFADFTLSVVHAQIHRINFPNYYDALSMEVIRPPFRYMTANKDEKPRLGLGSAAIASVTNTLSPILPFTGGVDLRRDLLASSESWVSRMSSAARQIHDAFADQTKETPTTSASNIPRGGGRVPQEISNIVSSAAKKIKAERLMALSSPSPFIPVDQIAELTLSDVATAFRYALESSRKDFNEVRFFRDLIPRVKSLLAQVDAAVSRSRGSNVKAAVTGAEDSPSFGDIDALNFCAAMRIFAEWRVVRQVPDGYKGFAVGMNLGHKDIVQNVAKIEQAAHSWLDQQGSLRALQSAWENEATSGNCDGEGNCPLLSTEVRSPTLNDLLQYEIETDVHPTNRLPRLRDRTGAMGLLWVRRQLHYQTALFANILQVPSKYSDTRSAIAAAYKEVYDRYHGWAVQKIFNYSFQAAPEAEEVYKFMNPHRLKEILNSSIQNAPQLNKKQGDNLMPVNDSNPIEKFFQHIGKEWLKLTGSVSHILKLPSAPREVEVRGGYIFTETPQLEQSKEYSDEYIVQEMTKDAHDNIAAYLSVAQPLLNNLAGLFDVHNMDDPTVV